MQGKSSVPPKHFYSLEERNDSLVPEANVTQKEYYRVGRYAYRHRNDNSNIAYAHSILPPSRAILSMAYLLCLHAVIIMFILKLMLRQVLQCLLSHLLVCGWLRITNSSAGL